jgi:hypothetical protein
MPPSVPGDGGVRLRPSCWPGRTRLRGTADIGASNGIGTCPSNNTDPQLFPTLDLGRSILDRGTSHGPRFLLQWSRRHSSVAILVSILLRAPSSDSCPGAAPACFAFFTARAPSPMLTRAEMARLVSPSFLSGGGARLCGEPQKSSGMHVAYTVMYVKKVHHLGVGYWVLATSHTILYKY